MSDIQYVDDKSFPTVVKESNQPVLVDFWASWCGPCLAMNPILEQLAAEHGDKLTVAKVNVDENPQLAAEYRITSIPAMKVFKNGEVVDELIGSRPKQVLEHDLAAYLG